MGSIRTHLLRIGAMATAAAVVTVSAGPALAAEPVAQASATGLRLTIASTPTDSGTYTVTHDGTKETASGSNEPAISALGGQSFIQAGTLSQDAGTVIRDKKGYSAACAGLAGDGATLVEVAEGGCLVPGQNLDLNAGTVDLTGIQILGDQFPQELQDALQPVLDPLLGGLTTALQTVLDGGGIALGLNLGAVQSYCTAQPGSADGDTDITDATLDASLGGQSINLVTLPTNPPPNTRVVTDLGVVVQSVLDALRTEFETAIDGALGPLTAVIDGAEVLAEALEQVGEALAPLEENVLEITLNKQERPSSDSIQVTALDLHVLPAAEAAGVELVGAQIGETACGPNSRVSVDDPDPTPTPSPTPEPVPTSVPAGVESVSGTGGIGTGGNLALLLLVALSAGAGVASYRRALRG
ncbi:hypothetical protein NOMA109596_17570 [Nocardioides marinus]|uniref:Choice-of-anchor G family protein n=1 Tax=Nocardioides marinus TaxID=374514 RepID=A0A7Y9YH91_9ACTN|nr:hypothetical protein [Nocardioides marinus]NYI12243.1 hypothetical protein [Nocardioides marinus]